MLFAQLGVLEEALKAGMQTAEDYRNLWLEYCSYLRRRINWGTESEQSLLSELRETVQTAIDYLEQSMNEVLCSYATDYSMYRQFPIILIIIMSRLWGSR